MKPIDLIEELLSEYSHIIINGRLKHKNHINFAPIKNYQIKRIDSGVNYRVICNKDQVSFIVRRLDGVNSVSSTHFRPKEYTLLNVDLKNPRSIIDIRQFLERLR